MTPPNGPKIVDIAAPNAPGLDTALEFLDAQDKAIDEKLGGLVEAVKTYKDQIGKLRTRIRSVVSFGVELGTTIDSLAKRTREFPKE